MVMMMSGSVPVKKAACHRGVQSNQLWAGNNMCPSQEDARGLGPHSPFSQRARSRPWLGGASIWEGRKGTLIPERGCCLGLMRPFPRQVDRVHIIFLFQQRTLGKSQNSKPEWWLGAPRRFGRRRNCREEPTWRRKCWDGVCCSRCPASLLSIRLSWESAPATSSAPPAVGS